MELLDAFQSMEHSNEQLTDILEIAKQTAETSIKDDEIRQIEDLLRKLQDTFANTSATELLKLTSVRGEFQEQKEKITQIGAQFQSMEALMANMAQTLLGLDSIRNRFGEIYGDYTGVLANLEKSQQTSNGAKLNLMQFSLEQTKETIEQSTMEFKRQMLDVMSLYEALGAQYYQLMESNKIDEYENIQTPPPEPADDHGDNEENAEQQNAENAEQQAEEVHADSEHADAEAEAVADAEADAVADAESEPEVAAEQAEQDAVAEILAVTDEQIVQELTEQYGNDMPTDIINAIDDLEEEQQQQMLLRGGAIGGAASAGGEQQAAGGGGAGAASAGGEQQAAGGGGSGGAAAAPAGAEQQQAAGGGGAAHAAAAPAGAEQQQAAGGGGAAHAAAAPAGAEQQQAMGGGGAGHAATVAPAGAEQQHAMGAHGAQQQNDDHHAATIAAETDRGRSDEREKLKSRKPRSRKAKT